MQGGPSFVGGPSCANNYPLRGGKGNDFSGGTRVAAWVNGGLLPDAVRGGTVTALIHMADWFATVCGLANVDPHDETAAAAGLPAMDSLDQWPVLSTPGGKPIRKELVTGFTCRSSPCTTMGAEGAPLNAALLDSDGYKLVIGNSAAGGVAPGLWWGPSYPNASAGPGSGTNSKPCGVNSSMGRGGGSACVNTPGGAGCGPQGCLFNIFSDESEKHDLSASMPARKASMMARLEAIGKTVFQSDEQPDNFGKPDPQGALARLQENGGYFGPWLG